MKKIPNSNLFAISLAIFLGIFHASNSHSANDVNFFFPPDNNGIPLVLTCNGVEMKEYKQPTVCSFDSQDKLKVALNTWNQATATLSLPAPIKLTGPCRGSLREQPAFTFHLNPPCLPNDGGGRQDATGKRLVDEWFADLPWHQKLSTRDSNLIDIPFVLPFAAIPPDLDKDKPEKLSKARYMLRYGIVNVMAMHRTDTLYHPDEVPKFPFLANCNDGQCVELKFDIQRFHTQTNDPSGYAADIATNDSRTYAGPLGPVAVPALGFAITESTIFAPWLSWYTGHFCTLFGDNIRDSVCYEDYFTTQLQAVTKLADNQVWLRDSPSIFDPQSPDQFGAWCKKGDDHCPMYLGKVFLDDKLTEPNVVNCKTETECQTQQKQVQEKTQELEDAFDTALSSPTFTNKFADIGRFPWDEKPVTPEARAAAIQANPFIGFYNLTYLNTEPDGSYKFKAPYYVLPRACTAKDFADARGGVAASIPLLKACAADFEVHTNGFFDQWKLLYGDGNHIFTDAELKEINSVLGGGLAANQYGRTMFMLAGLPEQKVAVSYFLDTHSGRNTGKLPIYDQVYGASLYTQYLPQVNPDDQTEFGPKNKVGTPYKTVYEDNFWHMYFMSNHMNQTPDHFIRGIRGRTLWHNEYRSNLLYSALVQNRVTGKFNGILDHVDFPAGFQRSNSKAPYHGNTCDSCHIRNGSGIPLMPNGQLSNLQQAKGMNASYKLWYKPEWPHPDITQNDPTLDYTYTNIDNPLEPAKPKQVIPSMKLVLFDLTEGVVGPLQKCDANDHTVPNEGKYPKDKVYGNPIMNFYGNVFHVNLFEEGPAKTRKPTYTMDYVPIEPSSGFQVVDTTTRRSGKYLPQRARIANIDAGTQRCSPPLAARPPGVYPHNWPNNCTEVSGTQVEQAINSGQIGFMHLVGKRLGNTPLLEMIPDASVIATQHAQRKAPDSGGIKHAGCYGLAPGTRVGSGGATHYRSCTSQQLGTKDTDCYLSRFGWIGDRASLEDQIANAAFTEQNISTKQGYEQINPNAQRTSELVRYIKPLCGPADLTCQTSKTNSDIEEQEVRDMATYQRWIGIPQRSEYQVSTAKVQQGEKHFRALGCASCHVIDKIAFVETDNSLPDEERAELKKLQNSADPKYPFISYLGTDLLLHDMGYLSQVTKKPVTGTDDFRQKDKDGVINPKYRAYIQLVRTPPLKGLRFNRFVTDSNHNSTLPIEAITSAAMPAKDIKPGCDFLLHDGRACDAIEAAYLHDGPAVKALKMIEGLNKLSDEELMELRAFLYSL